MVIAIKKIQFGHSAGFTDICYSANGEKIVSCGSDGDIRIWNGIKDEDPLQACIGEFALCVLQKDNHIIIGTESFNAQLVGYNGERVDIFTRFRSHLNHMALGLQHNWIALACADMSVKLMEYTTKETKTFELKGPPLGVAICPNVKFLSVSCGDGRLIVYNVEDQHIIKEFDVVPKANDFFNAKLLCRSAFDQKQGKYFAYPVNKQITILNTVDWLESFSFSTEQVDATYSIVSFSPCGNYICGITLLGDVVVWSLIAQSLIGFTKNPNDAAITSLAWDPRGNGELAFGDMLGNIGVVQNCAQSETSKPESVSEKKTLESNSMDIGIDVDNDIDFGDVQIDRDEDSDDDNENAVSLDKIKKDVMGLDDIGEIDKESYRSESPKSRSGTPEIQLQPSFMSGSTPDHLDPRYMCWNDVGVVRCYGSSLNTDDEGTRSIEVEFHDSTLHNSMMMSNYQQYTMASISTTALAVANNTSLKVIPLGASMKEWQLSVTEDVAIICLATSHNLVCMGTANYLVHVCTVFGTQKCILSVPGPIISMSAFGHVLIIAYHVAAAREGDQCIECMLVKMEGIAVESRNIKSALGPGTKLQWIGFTDVGTPAMMDSNGMVYLHPLQTNTWLPFCDTRKQAKSPIDGFFMVAIYESYGNVRGVRCKGSQYPGFTPRPIAIEIALQAPFAELDSEKSQLEANLFTWSTLQINGTDKKYKETALKSFALAAKNSLDQKALELIEMLGNSQILTLAMKYASKLDKKRLTERLQELSSKMNNDNLEYSKMDDLNISTPNSLLKPNKKLLLNSSSRILAKNISENSQTNNCSPSISKSTTSNNQQTPTSYKSLSGLTGVDTQASSSLEEPKNPFLKSLNKPKSTMYNPLSLTDTFAGFNVEKEQAVKENIKQVSTEKRKKPDSSPVDKTQDKQRKLDKFMFSKRT